MCMNEETFRQTKSNLPRIPEPCCDLTTGAFALAALVDCGNKYFSRRSKNETNMYLDLESLGVEGMTAGYLEEQCEREMNRNQRIYEP